MNLHVCIAPVHELRTSLLLESDYAAYIVPLSHKYLLDNYCVNSFIRNMIEDGSEYTCLMDLLFCEIFTQFKELCMMYYQKKGPLLKHYITPKSILMFDNYLLNALKIGALVRKTKPSWDLYMELVRPKNLGVLTEIPTLKINHCYKGI